MSAKIAAAFVKAQKGFAPALKTSSNPFFKSKYADLAACVEAVLDSLNNNGIALIQCCHESDTGVIVETTFVHESGEVITCGKLHVPAAKGDPQGYGSALTYARRYSLMAACGIAPEDDDGNAASRGKPTKVPEYHPEIEERTYLEGVVDTVLANKIDYIASAEYLHGLNLDADQKTWVWDKLDSKTRSGIKAVSKKE